MSRAEMAYQLCTPLVGLFLLIVGFSNMGSPITLAIFVASLWIFMGMMIK